MTQMATKMKSIAKPGSGFNTHLLSMEEVWYVRDHPFNVKCVKVKKLVLDIDAAEKVLEDLRAQMDSAVEEMNEQRLGEVNA